MKTQKMAAIAAILLLNQVAFAADASYQTTTQITGGTFVDTLKQVSFISKSIKEMLAPTSTLTMVHGNQKAVVNKDSTEITDLDKECIIRIDTPKKDLYGDYLCRDAAGFCQHAETDGSDTGQDEAEPGRY